MKAHTKSFDLLVDGAPYQVKVTPYKVNTEIRFRVSYNGSPVYIFTWNEEQGRMIAADKGAQVTPMPQNLESAIAMQLSQAA